MHRRGADAPVVPGVMPITNVRQVERMAAMSGTGIPDRLAEKLLAVAYRPDLVRQVGVEHATLLCGRLLDGGARPSLLHDEPGCGDGGGLRHSGLGARGAVKHRRG
jgi:5,10-methylenetetrahydrofolate reductase